MTGLGPVIHDFLPALPEERRGCAHRVRAWRATLSRFSQPDTL